MRAWWSSLATSKDTPDAYLKAVQEPHYSPSHDPMAFVPPTAWCPFPRLQLSHTGVSIELAPGQEGVSRNQVASRMRLTPTSSLLSNIGRIFAAATVGAPLLLVGGPGIGKTAAVTEVARVTGQACQRINCGANTSVSQLFGSNIPR